MMIKENMYEPITESGCWIWMRTVNSGGYGNLKVKGKTFSSNRAAYIDEHGSIPEGLWVLHTCDCRLCVNPAHLYAGTHQDNMDDKRARERTHNIKYRKEFKRDLTERFLGGEKQVDLAKELDMPQSQISSLISSYRNNKAVK